MPGNSGESRRAVTLDGTLLDELCRAVSPQPVEWPRLKAPDNFVHGAVVAVATIEDVVTKERASRFGKWFFGKYGFVLSDVQALRQPVPTTGRLGLARASSLLQRRVERALKA